MENIKSKNSKEEFILKGNLWKVAATLSWSAVIAMAFYGLNSMMDAFVVGRYIGEAAVAGVSLAYPVASLSVSFGSLVGVGAGSLLSIAIGAKDEETQNKLISNANGIILIATVIFMVFALMFAEPLIKMMGGDAETLPYGVAYFNVAIYGALFWVMGLALNMIIRAEGKMITAMIIMSIGLIVNILCTYIFVAYLNMGVEGAAWGTNIGMFVYSIIGLMYFSSNKASFKTKVFSFKIDKDIALEIVNLGTPSLLMSIMTLVQSIVLFNALANYGTTSDIAFYGVVNRIFNFMLTPIMGLLRSFQPVLGQNYGAKQYDRVIKSYKVFSYYALILTIPFWLVGVIIPKTLLAFMLPGVIFSTQQVLAFITYMSTLVFLAFVMMGMTFFPAVKKPMPASILGLARQLVFYVPAMLILPRFFGANSVYYISFAIDLIITIWCMLLLKREFNNLRTLKIEE